MPPVWVCTPDYTSGQRAASTGWHCSIDCSLPTGLVRWILAADGPGPLTGNLARHCPVADLVVEGTTVRTVLDAAFARLPPIHAVRWVG